MHEEREEESDVWEERNEEGEAVLQSSCPLGVQPLGNLLVRGGRNGRDEGIGSLSCFSDEIVGNVRQPISS